MSLNCPACGHPIEPLDRFCSECGHELPRDLGGDETLAGSLSGAIAGSGPINLGEVELLAGLAPGEAALVVRRGPGEGTTYVLTGDEVIAGRAPAAELFLDDVTVSRRHAAFRRSDSGWSIIDLGSLNGTYVNRERVDTRELRPGDEVQVGKYRFAFLMPGFEQP